MRPRVRQTCEKGRWSVCFSPLLRQSISASDVSSEAGTDLLAMRAFSGLLIVGFLTQIPHSAVGLQCAPKINELLQKYYAPHLGGISKDQIDDALCLAESRLGDSQYLVQVIGGRIYSRWFNPNPHFWERERLEFVLERLSEYLQLRHKECSRLGSADCERDFEFVLVTMAPSTSIPPATPSLIAAPRILG